MTIAATAFWRRLDTEGHDCCQLEKLPDGWRLVGNAVFIHEGKPCGLAYHVDCDASFRTVCAAVHGAVGSTALDLDIRRERTGWLLNGRPQPEAGDCIDLDLGFTPATNLIAIRRLDPDERETPAPAAYYLEFSLALGMLEQTYRRTGPATLDYASPAHNYRAELKLHPSGFVEEYPGLWSGHVVV